MSRLFCVNLELIDFCTRTDDQIKEEDLGAVGLQGPPGHWTTGAH